jgi:CTP:molybdopterin cytidylyltransferase MocA
MTAPRHAAVLLAAGGSRRLGVSKQLLLIDGVPLVRRAALAALATAPAQAVVVVGAEGDAVYAAVADLGIARVDCAGWEEGMSASIRAGLQVLAGDIDAALFLLCDQPALDAPHLRRLVDCWRATSQRAAASAYGGVLGVPAVLPRGWFDDLRMLTGDRGARELLRSRPEEVVGVPEPALAHDVDRPGDLDRHKKAGLSHD